MPIKSLKHQLYRYFLQKKLKSLSVDRKSLPFEKVRHIGIIFNATDPGNSVIVDHFAQALKLQDKRVEILAFFNFNKVEGDQNYPYFCKKDLLFYQQPKKGILEHFLNKKFDLLINAYVEDSLPLEYISTFSQAKFRIGLYREDKTYYADWMIQSKEENLSLEKLLKEIDHYLNKINTYE